MEGEGFETLLGVCDGFGVVIAQNFYCGVKKGAIGAVLIGAGDDAGDAVVLVIIREDGGESFTYF